MEMSAKKSYPLRSSTADEIMRAGKGHEKEYIVKTDRPINGVFLQKMSSGVYLDELGITTRKCSVKYISERSFSIVLNEGKNRQIRRMCEHFDYRVRDLKRIRVVNKNINILSRNNY